jgi:hypothetical protein
MLDQCLSYVLTTDHGPLATHHGPLTSGNWRCFKEAGAGLPSERYPAVLIGVEE